VNNLPFLKPKGWPKRRKMAGEYKYGFSEADEMQEEAVKELMAAVHSKDHKRLMDAVHALIDCIHNEEEEEHAPET
jgi:hypothetical protein